MIGCTMLVWEIENFGGDDFSWRKKKEKVIWTVYFESGVSLFEARKYALF